MKGPDKKSFWLNLIFLLVIITIGVVTIIVSLILGN